MPTSRSKPALVVTLSLAAIIAAPLNACRQTPASSHKEPAPAIAAPMASVPPGLTPNVRPAGHVDPLALSPAASAAQGDGGAVAAPVTGGPLPGAPSSFAPLVRRVRPAVVSIFTARVELVGSGYGFMNPQERVQR
ncbi:MAG: hypothetical protein WCJ30_25620, partial [Deltaproteobacteria bacterium]